MGRGGGGGGEIKAKITLVTKAKAFLGIRPKNTQINILHTSPVISMKLLCIYSTSALLTSV